jgi:hypothetical protein
MHKGLSFALNAIRQIPCIPARSRMRMCAPALHVDFHLLLRSGSIGFACSNGRLAIPFGLNSAVCEKRPAPPVFFRGFCGSLGRPWLGCIHRFPVCCQFVYRKHCSIDSGNWMNEECSGSYDKYSQRKTASWKYLSFGTRRSAGSPGIRFSLITGMDWPLHENVYLPVEPAFRRGSNHNDILQPGRGRCAAYHNQLSRIFPDASRCR